MEFKTQRKEFVLPGANSFHKEQTPILKVFTAQGSKQEATKLSPFVKIMEIKRKNMEVPIHLKNHYIMS